MNEQKKKIAILCADEKSNYFKLANRYNLDIYTLSRSATNFDYSCPVIAHPPCAQWSRLHAFATPNQREKELAWFCLEAVNRCGGIFEHPSGSHFFKTASIKPTISVDQHWFGYPARKRTYLYFSDCSPIQHPLSLDAPTKNSVTNISRSMRSRCSVAFCVWLIECTLLVYLNSQNSEK